MLRGKTDWQHFAATFPVTHWKVSYILFRMTDCLSETQTWYRTDCHQQSYVTMPVMVTGRILQGIMILSNMSQPLYIGEINKGSFKLSLATLFLVQWSPLMHTETSQKAAHIVTHLLNHSPHMYTQSAPIAHTHFSLTRKHTRTSTLVSTPTHTPKTHIPYTHTLLSQTQTHTVRKHTHIPHTHTIFAHTS